MKNIIKHWRTDMSAGLVVYLVALPLCLGIGLASTNLPEIEGLPNLFSGIIAGVIGGLVVGSISKSRVGVSGPAAGLILIVLGAIVTLGSFEAFLLAVVISGVVQVIAGITGFGIIGDYFPSSVIKGMLAAIGLTLILKEIPHAFGYDVDFFGDESFAQADGHNTFSELFYMFRSLHPGAVIISIISIALLILFSSKRMKKKALFKVVPGALFVVILGVALNELFKAIVPALAIGSKHLVQLPVANSISDLVTFFRFPDFSFLTNPDIYVVALTIALVGSLETLLSVEATDKLDPEKGRTPTNRELIAQGTGNVISGLIGGLPITQVIVRSSANVNAGVKTKFSAIIHGVMLAITVVFIPNLINLIPLASLAAILIMVGYKLSSIALYKKQFTLGFEQFIPFAATVVGVLFTDLLKGIGIGMVFAIFYILRKNYRNNFKETQVVNNEHKEVVLTLSEDVTFLNKAGLMETLDKLPENAIVTIDGSRCRSIDYDVLHGIQEFTMFRAKDKNIVVNTINVPEVVVA